MNNFVCLTQLKSILLTVKIFFFHHKKLQRIIFFVKYQINIIQTTQFHFYQHRREIEIVYPNRLSH